MMRKSCTLLACLAVAALVADGSAQESGRRRGRRRQQPRETQTPAKKPPEKKKPEEKPAKPVAYTNAVVHVGNTAVLRRATVLIQGDKITGVGRSINLPEGAKVVDCTGKHVCPGFVIFDLTGAGAPSRVGKDESYRDFIDPYARNIKRALAAGITSYLTMSSRGGTTPTGTSAVLKCVPESLDGAVVKEPAAYALSVPLGPAAWQKLDETFEAIDKYDKEKAEFEKKKAAGDKSAKEPKKPPSYDEVKRIKEGKAKLRISGGSAGSGGRRRRIRFGGSAGGLNVKAIREALRIGKRFGVGVVLDNATESWIVADEIAATGSSCILMPRNHRMPDPARQEKHGSSIHASAILAKAGVPVAVLPPGGIFGGGLGTGGILGQDLNTPTIDPCFAVRGGMDENEALATITLYPAMMMGVDGRIGSLETGKDADLLILDGDPLHYKTFVETAVVNGKVAYEKAKEPFYRHIRPASGNR